MSRLHDARRRAADWLRYSSKHLSSELTEWQYRARQPGLRHEPRHAPHDAAGFVLRQDLRAALAEQLTTSQAVLTHTCEHHCQHTRAQQLRGGTKERVDRRPT